MSEIQDFLIQRKQKAKTLAYLGFPVQELLFKSLKNFFSVYYRQVKSGQRILHVCLWEE
ncbi:hypothetical protein NSTC745_02805 [Nostoc sp. DSM 114161]|jgi:hypothetical protein